MKRENQALRLEKLMQRHQCYPEYELCIPSVAVKKSALKRLGKGDLLLLGMGTMEMLLISQSNGCAKVMLSSHGKCVKIEIIDTYEKREEKSDSKKYKTIKLLLGKVQSRVLEIGHNVETVQIDFNEVLLYEEEKKIANARLVVVDDEIAVQIKEVVKQ
jgi:hypothetical protein